MMAGMIYNGGTKCAECEVGREAKQVLETYSGKEHDEDTVLQVCSAVTEVDERQSYDQGYDAVRKESTTSKRSVVESELEILGLT